MNHHPIAKFSLIPSSSVALYAESLGHANLGEDVIESLSEDVTYRIREILNNAVRYTRHSKRRYLTTEDLNLALTRSNSQAIYGQNGVDVPNFRTFNFKDSTLSYMEDRDANLRETAFDQTLPADPGDVSIKVQWLVFEGQNCSGGKQTKDDIASKEVLEEPFANFLERIISSVFGTNTNARMVALETIRTNGKLQSILPYLVTFLASQVKSCNGNDNLKSIVKGVLFIAHALTENTSLFLIPYVLQLVKLLLFIITDGNLPVSFWRSKLNAARILTQLCRRHMSTMNYLPHHLLKAYQEALVNDSKSLGSVYGAAFAMSCLGAELTHQLVYPLLIKRIPGLVEAVDGSKDLDTRDGSLAVLELFQMISSFLLRTATLTPTGPISMKTNRTSGGAGSGPATTPSQKFLAIYNEVSDIFGETIAFHAQLHTSATSSVRNVFMPCRTTTTILGHSKSQDGSSGLQNVSLKKEPQSGDNDDVSHDFLKHDGLSLADNVNNSDLSATALPTSLGLVKTTLNLYKRKYTSTGNVFSKDITAGSSESKRTRRENDVNQRVHSYDRAQILKLSRRFFRIQRIRLIDLARIPSTTYIAI